MSDPARPLHPPHRPLTELAAWLAAADPTARAHGDLTGGGHRGHPRVAAGAAR